MFYSGFRWLLASATCSVPLSTSLSTFKCVCRRLLASVCCYLPLSLCVCLCRLLLAHLGLHCPSVCFYSPLLYFICLCRISFASVDFILALPVLTPRCYSLRGSVDFARPLLFGPVAKVRYRLAIYIFVQWAGAFSTLSRQTLPRESLLHIIHNAIYTT